MWKPEPAGKDVVPSVYAATHRALHVLQVWLEQDRPGTLIVLTHGAMGLANEDITDLAGAAVWGLCVRLRPKTPDE